MSRPTRFAVAAAAALTFGLMALGFRGLQLFVGAALIGLAMILYVEADR